MNGHRPSAHRPAATDRRAGARRASMEPMELVAVFALLLLAGTIVAFALTGAIDLLKGIDPKAEGDTFKKLQSAIDELRGPATAAVAGVGSLGVAVGGVIFAAGSPKGMRILLCAALALVAIAVGNGIIA